MNDLEDRILKQNIPGRYTSWNEEGHRTGDDSTGTNDESDDASKNYESSPQIPNNSKLHHHQQHQNSSSYCYSKLGGVKGVLSDFKRYQHYEHQKQETSQIYSPDRCEKQSAYCVESTRKQQQKSNWDNKQNDENSSQSSSHEEEEEDEFTQKYRRKQMERWKAAQLPLQTYVGELVEVDPIQFAEIVDKEEQSNVPVFILLYENCIPECMILLGYMESIARYMTCAKFLRLRAFAVDPTFDTVALPALMVYKNGQMIGNFVRVWEEFEPFTEDTVNSFLSVFCSPSAGMRNNNSTKNHPEVSDDEELEEFCSYFHNHLK